MFETTSQRFRDRTEAGRQLAAQLEKRQLSDPVVLALPRGGVPVGYEVARTLHAPLDVLLVRKIGAPGHEELGIGAVLDGDRPQVVLNEDTIAMLGVPSSYIEQERDRQLEEIERRRRLYRGTSPAVDIGGRTAIVVDDGIATGGTAQVALRALRNANPRRTVVAVPVAPADTLQKLEEEADDVVCLAAPAGFGAISMFYADFTQTTDEQVVELLEKRRRELAGAGA